MNARRPKMAKTTNPLPESDGLTIVQRLSRMRGGMCASELADLLGVSRITIYKQAAGGAIPNFRVGTAIRFDPRAVADWLEGR